MTPERYLTLAAEANEGYVDGHDHKPGECHHCDYARVSAEVARNMIRDGDYPPDVGECISTYYDNVMFSWEMQDRKAKDTGK